MLPNCVRELRFPAFAPPVCRNSHLVEVAPPLPVPRRGLNLVEPRCHRANYSVTAPQNDNTAHQFRRGLPGLIRMPRTPIRTSSREVLTPYLRMVANLDIPITGYLPEGGCLWSE
jgi:hypothetical protein